MAHNLESMFSVRQVPWHGLGHIVENAPTAAEAIKLAGLDWKVKAKPIYQKIGDNFEEIKQKKAMVRSDNDKTLAVLGNSYTPLQNKDAFGFFNKFIEAGTAKFETAGSLQEGKLVWVLASLKKAPIDVGGGDIINKYLLLSNAHDGTMAVRTGFTPVRVVCNNTLTQAHNAKRSNLIRVYHGQNVKQNIDNLAEIVNEIDAKFEATAEQYKFLASKQLNAKDLEKFTNIIFELRPDGKEREVLRAKKMQEQIASLFENGAGSHFKTAKGTAWGAYNAVTEYLTHMSSKDNETRLYGNWFGSGSRKNKEALETITEMVG